MKNVSPKLSASEANATLEAKPKATPTPRTLPRHKLAIYGKRPRVDMMRVLLSELDIDCRVIEYFAFDTNKATLIDAQALEPAEKTALKAAGGLGDFRNPIIILDNLDEVWPKNIEVINSLDKFHDVTAILDTYENKSWAEVEKNLRFLTMRDQQLQKRPRHITDPFNIVILTKALGDIPREIKQTLKQSFLNIDIALSKSEMRLRREATYGTKHAIDGILDITGKLADAKKTPMSKNIAIYNVEDFLDSAILHENLLRNRASVPLGPANINFDISEMSATYTKAFTKAFWKAHAKRQIQTFARLKAPLSLYTLPLQLKHEGQLCAHLQPHDSAGRLSKSTMGVALVGKTQKQATAFLKAIGLKDDADAIEPNDISIDRL